MSFVELRTLNRRPIIVIEKIERLKMIVRSCIRKTVDDD